MSTDHSPHDHNDDHDGRDRLRHAGHGLTDPAGSLRCPECGEPARMVPPGDWPLGGFDVRPAASHHNGTPLCPVSGPDGYQPAEPVGATGPLALWEAVRCGWLMHPGWTVAEHLARLDGDGYDTSGLTGDPAEVVGRWLAEHRRTGPVARSARTADPW